MAAHDERNKVRAAYNHAQYLPERRRMMQQWADYLDDLADGRKVVVGQFGRAANFLLLRLAPGKIAFADSSSMSVRLIYATHLLKVPRLE